MVRRLTYGEDIGQSSWMTAADWRGFAGTHRRRTWEPRAGSRQRIGGPAVHLASASGRVTGVDINRTAVSRVRWLRRGWPTASRF